MGATVAKLNICFCVVVSNSLLPFFNSFNFLFRHQPSYHLLSPYSHNKLSLQCLIQLLNSMPICHSGMWLVQLTWSTVCAIHLLFCSSNDTRWSLILIRLFCTYPVTILITIFILLLQHFGKLLDSMQICHNGIRFAQKLWGAVCALHLIFYSKSAVYKLIYFLYKCTLRIMLFPFFLQYLKAVASHKRYATNMVDNGHVHLLHLLHRRVCMVDMVVAPSENTWPTHIQIHLVLLHLVQLVRAVLLKKVFQMTIQLVFAPLVNTYTTLQAPVHASP